MGKVEVMPIMGIPEVVRGDDLGALVFDSIKRGRMSLRDRDVVVVTQKVVSKAAGRVLRLDAIAPGSMARDLARELDKDPRLVELILREAVRVVRVGHGVIKTETSQGFVSANSGVDQSNVGRGFAAMLPVDPDSSARKIRKKLERASGKKLAVVVTDTFGRPWRLGQTDVAIGCSGIAPLVPYAGRKDRFGYALRVTEPSVVDEIAAAAELVVGKLDGIPAALVRGASYAPGEGGVRSLVMPPERDLFR